MVFSLRVRKNTPFPLSLFTVIFKLNIWLNMAYAEVIGLGRSGIAAAKLLKQDGWDVTLSDAATETKRISSQWH